MSGRILIRAIELAIAAQFVVASMAQGADYRGAPSGWPTYSNGYYAANYPTNNGAGAAYYVARPVAAPGYAVAGYPSMPGAVTYVPARVAYANPTYYAAYGRAPVMYRPVSAAGYAPVDAYTRNATEGVPYRPVTANYAPANSYAVQPAGMSSAGSEAGVRFAQPTTVNYVAPQYNYRTTYAQVPVYMYRPVTAYQPINAQPQTCYQVPQQQTCLQASTCNTCQPQRSRCFSLLNPFTWFGHSRGSSGCGTSSCGPAQNSCTTNYCGQNIAQTGCGQQPYYPGQMTPVVPVYPVQPAPTNVIPAMPRGFLPSGSPTIPPPPTAAPGTRTIITPADTVPNLGPRPGVTPIPGTTIPTQPGGSFQTNPVQPGGTGSFGTGVNYPPASDPYSSKLTPVEKASGIAPSNGDSDVIRAPGSSPALPPSVQTVPDLDKTSSPRPINGAPKLLDPHDKTARAGNRWAAVPAKWPEQNAGSKQLQNRPVTQMRAYEAQNVSVPMNSPYKNVTPVNAANYDEGGWKTAAGF
jgi:hypothetical protein